MYATINFFKTCLHLILLFCILQEVKDANQAKWYKRMYESLHRTGKDGELQFLFLTGCRHLTSNLRNCTLFSELFIFHMKVMLI